jgi:hypothetical protein
MAFSLICAYGGHTHCWLDDCICGCHRPEKGRTNGERTDRKATQEEAEEVKKIPQGRKEGMILIWIRRFYGKHNK